MKLLLLFTVLASLALAQTPTCGSMVRNPRTGLMDCVAAGLPACSGTVTTNCVPQADGSGNVGVGNTVLNANLGPLVKPSATFYGRPPRILVMGDSILNTSQMQSRLQAVYPNATVELATYGGQTSQFGAAVLSSDVLTYSSPSQLLGTSNVGPSWTPAIVTVTQVASPSTGQQVWKLAGDGSAGQRVQACCNIVPSGAPPLTYSFVVEPGTQATFTAQIYNNTAPRTGIIIATVFGLADTTANHGMMPVRYFAVVRPSDGATYQAGDSLTVYLYTAVTDGEGGHAGYLYFSEPQLTVGLPTPYHFTDGSADSYVSPTWVRPNGQQRELYDLVIICWGRNDSSKIPLADYYVGMNSAIKESLTFAPWVMVVSCPPQANGGLTAWLDSSDQFQVAGYDNILFEITSRYRVGFYDAVAGFHALTTGGTETVGQLMRDQYHPTINAPSTDGLNQYIAAITAFLSTAQPKPFAGGAGTNGYHTRLLGQPSGSWALNVDYNESVLAPYGVLASWGRGSSSTGAGEIVDMIATTSGTLTYSISGSMLGLMAISQSGTGTVSVAIDGGSPQTVNLGGASFDVPSVYWLAGATSGLADAPHTVAVSWASGSARVIGVVGASGQ